MSNHPLAPEGHDDPQRKTILNLYAAFAVALILTLMPNMVMALVAGIFMIGVLIAAYIIRRKDDPHSLAVNHCTYIIRTIWIGSALSAVLMSIASLIMLNYIDYAAFEPCAQELAGLGLDAANASSAQIWTMTEPCLHNFIESNIRVLMTTGIFTILPILLYFIIRLVKGLTRALKGYRISDPKAWF